MRKILMLILLVMGVWSLSSAQKTKGRNSEKNEILLKIEQFSKFVMASDYDGIAASYTRDAKIFPNNRDIISGRDNIRNYWILPENVGTPYHKIMPEEIVIMGNEAYDYGYYEGQTKNADDSTTSWRGKYVIIWKKEEGDWKMYLDIWNRIATQ